MIITTKWIQGKHFQCYLYSFQIISICADTNYGADKSKTFYIQDCFKNNKSNQ